MTCTRLLRRTGNTFLKRDFKTVTDEEVYNVMKKLNNRPRKTLNFLTPLQAMQKSFTRTGISDVLHFRVESAR